MMQIVCGVCGEENGYSKSAISVSVKSGTIRIRTHLCPDCIAAAEDAIVEVGEWKRGVTVTEPVGPIGTDLRITNT